MWVNEFESEDYEAYASRSLDPGNRRVVFLSKIIPGLKPIIFDGAIPQRSLKNLFFPIEHRIPEIGIDLFENVIVSGAGMIFTSDRRALHGAVPAAEATKQLLASWSELFLESLGDDRFSCARLKSVSEIPHAAVIARAAPGNYHHFVADIFPRLHVIHSEIGKNFLREKGVDPTTCPILVNTSSGNRFIEMVREIGFDTTRLLKIPENGSVRVAKLFVPHVLNNFAHNWVSPELIVYYKEIMQRLGVPNMQSSFGERIFCLRRNLSPDRRRLHNNSEIAEILISGGFKEVSPERMSWRDQMLVFSRAKYIVGSFGSNNTNIVFSEPGARLLVIHPNESVYRLNVGMCAAGQQEIGYVWGESFSNPLRGEHVEFFVDRDLVQTAVDSLVS